MGFTMNYCRTHIEHIPFIYIGYSWYLSTGRFVRVDRRSSIVDTAVSS